MNSLNAPHQMAPASGSQGRRLRELEPILRRLQASSDLSSQTRDKFLDLLIRFAGYLDQGQGLESVSHVTAQHIADFLESPPSRDPSSDPAPATMHLRRSAVRYLFRLAREAGLDVGDPTLDLSLPKRARRPLRALTDDEIEACRSTSIHTLTETRLPAAWALAEATARTSELPHIRISDLDLASGRVWIHGGSKTEPRYGHLTTWGSAQLERTLQALLFVADQDPPVIYKGKVGGASGQASACAAIAWTLRRSGLATKDVRPASVAAWAGVRMIAEGLSLEEVARRLGIRSLDRAADFVGFDWRGQKAGQ